MFEYLDANIVAKSLRQRTPLQAFRSWARHDIGVAVAVSGTLTVYRCRGEDECPAGENGTKQTEVWRCGHCGERRKSTMSHCS